MTNMMLLPTVMTDRTVTATEREKVMIMPPWTWGQEETISSRLGVNTEEWGDDDRNSKNLPSFWISY